MPVSSRDDRPSSMGSRLEASLLRLRNDLQSHARNGEAIETMYREWQGRWAGRREEVVQRLKAIDSHLKDMLPESETGPRLIVVGGTEDSAPRAARAGQREAVR